MHCDDIRDQLDKLWDGQALGEIRQHLASCAACSSYHRDLRLVRAGFSLLRQEETPAPSLGFAQRLVRQLTEVSKVPSVADFFERVGRRFVYATLALTLLAILALAVPSTGPVRALTVSDIQVPAQEASLANSDPMGESLPQESPGVAPADAPVPAVPSEAK
jgi:hypothetical protein